MSQRIQLRGGTAAAWTAANPVLAAREPGVETDTLLYKIGDGVTPWNDLEYRELAATHNELDLVGQVATPAAPAAGHLKLYAKSLAGRMLLRVVGPWGVATPLQPSFFQNNIVIVSPNTTTSVNVFGGAVTSVGTLSHPVHNEDIGWMTNFASAVVAAATAGTGNAAALWQRGTGLGKAAGWFMAQRLHFPDADYNQGGAATGSRLFVGLTNQSMAAQVASDVPAGAHVVGFSRCHTDAARQDANWQFLTHDAVTPNLINTGMPFVAGHVYDFYIACAPGGDTIYWRIDDVTADTTMEGSTEASLPVANTLMRAGFQLQTVNAVARNVRMQRIYTESDR